jgi:hypothetical protein
MGSPPKHAAAEAALSPPSDIVWGASAIAKVINRSERQAYWLLEQRAVPAKKIRGVWVGSRSRLIAHCTDGEAEPQS